MRWLVALGWLGMGGMRLLGEAIPPQAVAILYNAGNKDSEKLAQAYRAAREIPEGNLIGLRMPESTEISREEYEGTVEGPLRAQFEERGWWQRGKDANGVVAPVANRIRVMVLMRGVPLKIKETADSEAMKDSKDGKPKETQSRNQASVDSELASFGVEGIPKFGAWRNQFYRSEKPLMETSLPFLVLTARIDGATMATCERMIREPLEVEKTGLWGRAYVDIANKFPQGDQWLETIVSENLASGIPTVVDRFEQTLPKHYPMTDASLYYGWYAWNVNGPFVNPRFRFRPGAVALHIHSFSAEQLRNPKKNWSAALLEKGAVATVGNVYEPFLHLTHQCDLLHQSLLAGRTWVEAAWMSMPVTSWQGVVLGDPLYRPFARFDGSGERKPENNDYLALRLAALEWPDFVTSRQEPLAQAAERTRSGVLAEAIGLGLLEKQQTASAVRWFINAKERYVAAEDKMRQDFHLIAVDRQADRKGIAIQLLRDAQLRYNHLPEAEALSSWLDILDPPPPPPARPKQ